MFRTLAILILTATPLLAQTPLASYLFPAGGQRGTKVPVRVGGLNLHNKANLLWPSTEIQVETALKPIGKLWFEGPLLPMPDSQRTEDYPFDMQATFNISPKANITESRGRIWTSQGITAPLKFIVGDLPEVVENEIDGEPIPERVTLPVTANGRIFPREDIDLWKFAAKKGKMITAICQSTSFGSPMVARLEVLDAEGNVIAEQSERAGVGQDAAIRFAAPSDGDYTIRIRDARSGGSQSHVYRLTITDGPVVDRIYPLGGRAGSEVNFHLNGASLTADRLKLTVPKEPGSWTALNIPLDSDDVPEYLEPAKDAIATPAMLNGRIPLGKDQTWNLTLKKGVKYEFDVRARKLGSPLCARVTVIDATGKEVSVNESATPLVDPSFTFQASADGEFKVRIAERFRNRGGDEFAYRLKVSEASTQQDFKLTTALELLNIPRGSTAKMKVTVERLGGFTGSIDIACSNLPAGVTVANATLTVKQNSVDLTFAADTQAKVQPSLVKIVGTSAILAHELKRETPELAVIATVSTPFKFNGEYTLDTAPRGQPYKRNYTLERNGFTGPITVQMADRQARHVQGVTSDPIVVPGDQSAFEYKSRIPAWIECGRTSRVTLVATGVIKDPDGSEHIVGFTSVDQNHQMIMVPEPGRLGIDLERDSARVVPGKTIHIPVKISRAKGVQGEVTISLVIPQHMKGITSASIVVPADRDHGELAITFASENPGPFNMPALIRAKSGDLVAETAIELIPTGETSRKQWSNRLCDKR